MRHYECQCSQCNSISQQSFKEPYPEYGVYFDVFCKTCGSITTHTRTLTKKTKTEIKKAQDEHDLKESIISTCAKYGFKCRFLYESVIISTEISDWSFRYHDKRITLRHESTYKINLETGQYARTHVQFKDRVMTPAEVIDYIASHDEWKKGSKSLT